MHNEIVNMKRVIGSDYIVRLLEVIEQRTQVHLVMELCQGMPLYHHCKKTGLSEATCKDVFRKLVTGVAFMHSKNVAHRDLKMDNVLFCAETQKVKIIDFGFSTETAPDSRLDTYCGTPHYMCPDLAQKRPYLAHAADIWALGVILYAIYTGSLPF